MNQETFVKAVKNKAHGNVQSRIYAFKGAIDTAIGILFEKHRDFVSPDKAELVLLLAVRRQKEGWPKELWEKEEARIEKELFDLMDPIQQALRAPEPSEDDHKPEEAEKGGAA